jgi:hypothetical protein
MLAAVLLIASVIELRQCPALLHHRPDVLGSGELARMRLVSAVGSEGHPEGGERIIFACHGKDISSHIAAG